MAKLGCPVYLIPEYAAYGVKPKDAVVNGILYEFRTVTGKPNTFQWEFSKAKKKGDDTNVHFNILSDIGKEDAKHRVWFVLRRHPEYTGDIIISFNNGNKTYLWNTENLK